MAEKHAASPPQETPLMPDKTMTMPKMIVELDIWAYRLCAPYFFFCSIFAFSSSPSEPMLFGSELFCFM